MGYAIVNRLIGLVNKTLNMSFFQTKLSFSQLKLGFGSMTPEKTDLIEGRQQLNWYPETLLYSVGWTFSHNYSSLALPVWVWECLEDFLSKGWISQWINGQRWLQNSHGYTGSVNYWYIGFLKVFPYTLTLFWAQELFWWRF